MLSINFAYLMHRTKKIKISTEIKTMVDEVQMNNINELYFENKDNNEFCIQITETRIMHNKN